MTANKLAFLADLEQVIRDRIDNPSQESYTASLVAKGEAKVAAALLLKFLLATVRRDTLHQRLCVFGLKHLGLESS